MSAGRTNKKTRKWSACGFYILLQQTYGLILHLNIGLAPPPLFVVHVVHFSRLVIKTMRNKYISVNAQNDF